MKSLRWILLAVALALSGCATTGMRTMPGMYYGM
jgi:uncharacterized protein YceK